MTQPQQGASAERQIIGTRWAVVGGLVQGGMASVVQAFDLDNEFGQVALKLLPAATEDRWRRAAFEREQEALARLAHPNIVRLLEVGRDEGTDQRYLVFPWYPTRLQDRLRERGALSWDRWWEDYGGPILGALELIHRQGVVHRDLKPANVLLDADDKPMLIDFGIAKLERRLAPGGTVGGESLPFTPPEADTPTPNMATRDVHAWAALTVFAVSGADPYPDDEQRPADVLLAALPGTSDGLTESIATRLERSARVSVGTPAKGRSSTRRRGRAGSLLLVALAAAAMEEGAEGSRERRHDADRVGL